MPMPPVTIRPYRSGDEPHMLTINRAGAPGVSLLSQAELMDLVRLAGCASVAVVDEQIIGYLIALAADAQYAGEEFAWFRMEFGCGFLYVDQIAVAPQWRGRGVGRRLYQGLEDAAPQTGMVRLTCEINLRPPNPSSLLFHARQGFAEVGTLETRDSRLVSLQVKELPGGE